MRLEQGEKAIIIPAGIGMNPSVDPEVLDPQAKVALLVNLDTRLPGQWTKRLPIVKQSLNGLTITSDPIAMWAYLKKADAETYDVVITDAGKLYVRHHVTSGTPPNFSNLEAAWLTANSTPRYVFYRDKLFIFNGVDTLKFFLDGTGTYTAGTNYGTGGVEVPDYRPYTNEYSSNNIAYKAYDESNGGILGGYGNGIVQYRTVYEYEDGLLYGNPGGIGYHTHEISDFNGSNGYGNPVLEFQWFNRYQLERVVGKYLAESAANALVTARVLAYRHKNYADQPYTAWERSSNRNVEGIGNAGVWTDASIRTGTPLELDNDEPTRFKYATVVGGQKGVMVTVNRQVPRPIPIPIVKTAKWGTPTYRNLVTIVNNSDNTYTRPTVRVEVDPQYLETDESTGYRDITADYKDLVFTDSDGLSIWDCYECPFEPYVEFGDATTQFDITDEGGNTWKYTYDGNGTAPLFVTNGLTTSHTFTAQGQNFSANNKGTWQISAVTETAVTVSSKAAGTAETNKTVGTGYVRRGSRWFVVTPPELVAGQEIRGYLYYRDDATGTDFYGAWNNVLHPPYVDTYDIFLSWSNEYNWSFLSDSTDDDTAIRNRADIFDGNFDGDPAWDNSIDGRPYGLDTDNVRSTPYQPLLDANDKIALKPIADIEGTTLSADEDPIGRALDKATFELWFNVGAVAINTNSLYLLGGYWDKPGGSGINIYYIFSDAGGSAPAAGSWIYIAFQYGFPAGGTLTERWLYLGNTVISNTDWTYLGLSYQDGSFNLVANTISSNAPATNWDTFKYDTVDTNNASDSTYTEPAYEFGSGDGYWYVGYGMNMHISDVRLSERFLNRAELADRARDWTNHGNTDITDSTSQPDLSTSLDDTPESVTPTGVDETEVNWSKINGEVFPLEQTVNLAEAGTGVIEWQEDAVIFTENAIHRLVTNKRPDEWEILENIAQEVPGVGCIAPDSLTKTEQAIIFMSQKGLFAFDGESKPVSISNDVWRYWLDTYEISALKESVCFYWAREGQLFVSIPSTSSGNINRTYVLDWDHFITTGKTEWYKYIHDTAEDFGAKLWVLKNAPVDEQDAYFVSGFSADAVLYKIGLHKTLGDRTTTLTVTRPGTPNANTTRFTYTTVGTDPHFNDVLDTGDSITVNCPNFSDTDNNGTFTITAKGANYFEFTDADTGAEADVALGRDDGLTCATNNALYKDLDEDNNNVAIDWDVDTAEIVTDNADLNQIDIHMEQKQTSGTDRSSPIVTTVINRDGSTNQTLTDRTLSKVETLKPATHVADTVQLKLDPDSTNDATDQTRIKRIEIAVKPTAK